MGFLPLFFESLSHLICSGQAALSSQSDFFENQETIRGQSGFLFSQSFSQSYLLDIAHRDIYPGDKRVTKRALYKLMINIHS